MAGAPPYGADLAHIHDTGFGDIAKGAARALLGRLADGGIADGLVVDLGCGGGTIAAAAVAAGYDALGIDVSPDFVALARERAPGARFAVGSAHDVDLPPCVAVAAVGEVLGYLPGPDPDAIPFERSLARIAEALAPGGWFVFDLILAGDGPPLTGRGWRAGPDGAIPDGALPDGAIPDWAVLSETTEDPTGRFLVRAIHAFRDRGDGTYRRTAETHFARLFDPEAVQVALAGLGFEVETASGYGVGADLPPRRRAFLCRKATPPSRRRA